MNMKITTGIWGLLQYSMGYLFSTLSCSFSFFPFNFLFIINHFYFISLGLSPSSWSKLLFSGPYSSLVSSNSSVQLSFYLSFSPFLFSLLDVPSAISNSWSLAHSLCLCSHLLCILLHRHLLSPNITSLSYHFPCLVHLTSSLEFPFPPFWYPFLYHLFHTNLQMTHLQFLSVLTHRFYCSKLFFIFVGVNWIVLLHISSSYGLLWLYTKFSFLGYFNCNESGVVVVVVW